ncbi:MAG: CoA ester lyase [Acidobacteria bacterium]|nr:CoA ester lyase [Acidobacteriota bacterium]
MRSLLYVPGDDERKIAHARQSAADAVILDLEDAIAPERKTAARDTLARALRETDFGPRTVFVRINGLATPFAIEDARVVAATGRAGILIPKVEGPDDVITIAPILASQSETGSIPRRLLCLIESPRGVLASREIAASSTLVAGLVFGSADLTREIGCRLTEGEIELLYARSHVCLAARAAGIEVYDSPHFIIADPDGLRRSAQSARNLGYDGKTVIHPSHLETINEVFSPTVQEIHEARRIVEAMEAAEGRGAIAFDGRLVDQVHLAQARKILTRSKKEER